MEQTNDIQLIINTDETSMDQPSVRNTNYPNIKQSFGIVGILIAIMIVVSPILVFGQKYLDKELAMFFYYLASMGAGFWIVHNKRTKKIGVSDYNFEFSNLKIVLLVCVSLAAMTIGVVSPIVSSIPMPDFVKDIFRETGSQTGIISFLTIVIAAPILEEFIFRGIILDGLLKKYTPLKAILVSSALFGLIHLNPWQFVTAMIIGSFSGWVYYKTKKLTLSIIIHMFNNLIAFIGMSYADFDTMMEETLVEAHGGLLNLIMTILGCITIAGIGVYLLDKEFKKKRTTFTEIEA